MTKRARDRVTGRTYLECREGDWHPVIVLVRWGGKRSPIDEHPFAAVIRRPGDKHAHWGGPRNVLVQREDEARVVRPFRGLRRVPAQAIDAGHEPAAERGDAMSTVT